MSTTTKSKEALELSYVEFRQAKSRVNKALASTTNERTLVSKMQQLSDALKRLNVHHTAWVGKAGFTDDQLAAEKFSTAWLEKEWEEVDDLQDKVDELTVHSLPRTQLTTEESINIACSQMETVQSDISTKLKQLLQKTATPSKGSEASVVSISCISAYKEILAGVKADLENSFSVLADRIMLLDKDNSTNHCSEFEQFRREQHAMITQVQIRLAEAASVKEPVKESTAKSANKSLEMEKSKAPTFSGKTLDFPEFKRSWQAIAGVYWDDANQVEQIKHKVDQKTRRIISRCNSMKDVWEALDKEYAQEEEVIIAVNEELKNLTSSNCTVSEYIVELRNYLPGLEEALKSVNGLDHLCSPDRVNLLLTKLYMNGITLEPRILALLMKDFSNSFWIGMMLPSPQLLVQNQP